MSEKTYKKRRLYRFCDGSVDRPMLKTNLDKCGINPDRLREMAWRAYDNVCCEAFSRLTAAADIDIHTGKVLCWRMTFTSNEHAEGAPDDEGYLTFTETLKCCPFCGKRLPSPRKPWGLRKTSEEGSE